jgi:hypothetical protein
MSVLTALKRGLDGDTEINPAYRYRADTVWQHPVKAITPDVVAELAKLIGQIKPDVVLAALPSDAQAASSILGLGLLDGHPAKYVGGDLSALRDFYADAARRQLATAAWWD